MKLSRHSAFTLIEIIIVLGIIGILAATLIPNFVGFDTDARITATRTNLETLRTRINLFRAKEGHYPQSLGDLTSTYFSDAGIQKPYLKKLPNEMISSPKGNNSYSDLNSRDRISGSGGWVYVIDTAEVKVNVDGILGKRWGDYAEEEPSDW